MPVRVLRTAALLFAGAALGAHPCAAVATEGGAAQTPANPQDIVVTAPPLFRDIRPERELDQQGIASYGVSTVDELLGEVEVELGEDAQQPMILVNGERVSSLDDIAGLPVEVLRNLRVLPRGSAVRMGGTPGQRVISLTLSRRTRTATLTAAPKVSTEGDWHAGRGEVLLTSVKGSTRANLAFRARGESSLLESERGILQPVPTLPYARQGNIIAYPTNLLDEIDPQLSLTAGQTVTVVPMPANANPTLGELAADANQAAVTNLGDFRTLRPRTRNYELNGTYATRLAPWLTGTGSLRLSRNLSTSLRGLPTGLFVLSPGNAFSPFSTDVALAFYGRDPLRFRSRRDSGDASLTLNATFGKWLSNFSARYSQSRDASRYDRQDLFGAIALDDSIDPFTADLPGLIGIHTDRATARTANGSVTWSFTGPAFTLPAGDVQATIEGRLASNRLHSRSTFSTFVTSKHFHRNEQSIRGAIDVPLTSRNSNFLPQIGNLDATAEYSRVHYSDAGTISHHALGLSWEPVPPLRLGADIDVTGRPAVIQLLGNPVIISSDVRVFDPLTGETVDVVQITGGNPDLLPEKTRIHRVNALVRLVPRLGLQLNAEYTDTDVRHFVSSLPEASAAVMLAFPDRFIRDPDGILTTVDLRPVNFDSHREKRLRYGLSLAASIGGKPTPPARTSARSPVPRPGPATRIQLNVNHTVVFSDRIVIRSGLDPVNLLEGGAIGIAAGRVRHQLDSTASIIKGGLGARLGVTWRGPSTLETRIGGETEELRFSPLFILNFRAFTDAEHLFGRSAWTRSMRLSLNVFNLTNDRQKVRDSFGNTPLQYQPGYRDPLGRTVEFEVRKVF